MLEKGAWVETDDAFYVLVREDMLKYIRILRKVLSSQAGKAAGTRSMQIGTGPGRILGTSRLRCVLPFSLAHV
jgi:hypothetical protein